MWHVYTAFVAVCLAVYFLEQVVVMIFCIHCLSGLPSNIRVFVMLGVDQSELSSDLRRKYPTFVLVGKHFYAILFVLCDASVFCLYRHGYR